MAGPPMQARTAVGHGTPPWPPSVFDVPLSLATTLLRVAMHTGLLSAACAPTTSAVRLGRQVLSSLLAKECT